MKTRAEMMQEKKDAEAKKASKTSAAERTIPILGTEVSVKCPACDETVTLKGLASRADGKFECPECAAPIESGVKSTKVEKPAEKPAEEKPTKAEETTSGARSANFCGKCGAEWPLINGKVSINCGHTRALRVDDPRKAENMKSVTSSGVASPPAEPPSRYLAPTSPAPTTTVDHDTKRVFASWGKMSFPVGEALGIGKYNNMEIGPFSLSEPFSEGVNLDELVRRMSADMQKMADEAFDTQLVWFKEKLGLLK